VKAANCQPSGTAASPVMRFCTVAS
jgi:hypothetical protein